MNDEMKNPTSDAIDSNSLLATWLLDLKTHAESKGYGWLIFEGGDYEEFFKEGLTPEEAFDEELDAARQNC